MDAIDLAVHSTLHDSGLKAKEIAQRLGMNYQVLLNKTNPNNDTHKLTLREAVAIQLLTGTRKIQDAVSLELGEPEVEAPANLIDALLKSQSEHGDIAKAIQEARADGRWTTREIMHVCDEIRESIASQTELLQAVSQLAVKPQD